MKLKGLKGKPANGDINVTPLIDVVLVLLIIFMVITPILIQEMAVNLPEKTETVEKDDLPQEQLVAAVCQDGTFALNKKAMAIAELSVEVRRRLLGKSATKRVVFIDGHPDAAYDNVVILMDTVRDAGADKIGIAALKEGDEFQACTAPPADAPVDGQPAEASAG